MILFFFANPSNCPFCKTPLKWRNVGENLRRRWIEHLGLRQDVEKLGNGRLKVKEQEGRRQGRAKDDQAISCDLLQRNRVFVFRCQKPHLGELGHAEKECHPHRQQEDGIHYCIIRALNLLKFKRNLFRQKVRHLR